MILGTFNGANVIALPNLKFKDIKLTQTNTVAVNTNPWTRQQQVYDFQAGWWEADITLPPMKATVARQWFAFFSECRGQANVFAIGDPICAAPCGQPHGTPVVNGTGNTGYSLATRGWTPSAPDVLMAGDYIQVGYRLYLVTENATADGSGNATLAIWPQFRNLDSNVTDGTTVVTHGATGLFRLKENTLSWSTTGAKTYGFQFSVVEAL